VSSLIVYFKVVGIACCCVPFFFPAEKNGGVNPRFLGLPTLLSSECVRVRVSSASANISFVSRACCSDDYFLFSIIPDSTE